MAGERFVVLGLAPARSAWFRAVGLWSTSGALPVEFVKCLSREEVAARLASGQRFSALLADGGLPGVDRDLLATATAAGCAVLVVGDDRISRDWAGLGAARVLGPQLTRDELAGALEAHGRRVRRGAAPPPARPEPGSVPRRGEVVAVTGPGGTGASTAAMALAQALGDEPSRGPVLLADLRLHAELAMLHDAGDVAPGVQELVEAHRLGAPGPEALRGLVFGVPDRNYLLLLGLRRARHWSTVRPRAFEAALESLERTFATVVCDVDCDLEGEEAGGSIDVEERNIMARSACARARAVVVVGSPTTKGVHALVRVVDEILAFGVAPARILPVVNRAPRSARARAAIAAALGQLLAPAVGRAAPDGGIGAEDALPAPVFLPERALEEGARDGARLPDDLGGPLATGVVAVARRAPGLNAELMLAGGFEPVRPGSLGAPAEGDGDGTMPRSNGRR